jgi:hypothetical protein
MGMVFIIWDRLFGTFAKEEEQEKVVYGLTQNINTYNPITMVFHEWKAIRDDLKKDTTFKDKLYYVFGPPGWSHDGSKQTARQMRDALNKRDFEK